MPRYDYRCVSCDYEFEATHGMQDKDKVTVCPECEARTVQRLISKTSFRLKTGGVGWALNGYHNDGFHHIDIGKPSKAEGQKVIQENRQRALDNIKETS